MKKTLITMLVLSGVALAAQTTEGVAFTTPSSTITTANKYDLTKAWSLNFEFISAAGTAYGNTTNPKGTTIIDSDVLGVKVYTKPNADAVVTIGSKSFTKDLLNWTAWDFGWYLGGTTKLNLSYTGDTLTVTAIGADGSKQFSFSSAMTYDGDSAVSMSTGISQAQVGASNGKYWSLPTGTFTGTATVPVPEPATATLSLLALAGLAARRRRK
jgi:hypothetical protein